MGATLSESAHRIATGAETLPLRYSAQQRRWRWPPVWKRILLLNQYVTPVWRRTHSTARGVIWRTLWFAAGYELHPDINVFDF